MPWSDRLETKEQEVPDHVLVVIVQPVKTSHHVADLELLLGVLEEGHEGPLGALGQLRRAHRDVKPLLPKHSFPESPGAAQSFCGEADLSGLVLAALRRVWGCILVVGFLSIAHKVRGISVVPRASALWELPTCAGNIKPAGEARRPSS